MGYFTYQNHVSKNNTQQNEYFFMINSVHIGQAYTSVLHPWNQLIIHVNKYKTVCKNCGNKIEALILEVFSNFFTLDIN